LDDIGTKLNALITNENRWTGNELFDFMLALAAKRAIQNFVS